MRSSKILVALLLFVAIAFPVYAEKVPVGMVIDVSGTVEYTRDGQEWKTVKRNKFLFEGQGLRVGADGSAKFLNQKTNETLVLVPASELKIVETGLEVVSGELGGKESAGNLLAGLDKQFAKTQKYTTVRRSAAKVGVVEVDLPNVTLSDDYPEVVWENAGHAYAYRLDVEGTKYDVPASEAELIRVAIKPFEKNAKYFVEVLDGDKVIFTSKEGRLKWLDGKNLDKFRAQEAQVKAFDEGGFLYAGLLKDESLLIPALDSYQKFFEENKDDEDLNELRPFLIEVYSRLKLGKFKAEEMKRYQAGE